MYSAPSGAAASTSPAMRTSMLLGPGTGAPKVSSCQMACATGSSCAWLLAVSSRLPCSTSALVPVASGGYTTPTSVSDWRICTFSTNAVLYCS